MVGFAIHAGSYSAPRVCRLTRMVLPGAAAAAGRQGCCSDVQWLEGGTRNALFVLSSSVTALLTNHGNFATQNATQSSRVIGGSSTFIFYFQVVFWLQVITLPLFLGPVPRYTQENIPVTSNLNGCNDLPYIIRQ